MSSLADRLRGVIRPAQSGADPLAAPKPRSGEGGVSPRGEPGRPAPHGDRCDDAAEVLGGAWRESRGQRFLVVDRKYVPGYRHGRVTLADCLPPADSIWPRLDLLASAGSQRTRPTNDWETGKILFLDLETTGLAGGAGSYAFLVGCGWFEGGVFRLRQFFLSHFGAERVLLESVAELAAGAACVVTYNGKTFDLPLIETRFVLQRMQTPFADLPHVDMLHPARRL